MTAIRQEAIQMPEKVPEDKLGYVIQIMQEVNSLLGVPETKATNSIDIDQFVMVTTERGQETDNYIRELRDNNRI